jgi:hypothetical protein
MTVHRGSLAPLMDNAIANSARRAAIPMPLASIAMAVLRVSEAPAVCVGQSHMEHALRAPLALLQQRVARNAPGVPMAGTRTARASPHARSVPFAR